MQPFTKSFCSFSKNRPGIRSQTIGLIGALILIGALSAAQSPVGPSINETAAHKYRNIQVYKDLPADQLVHVMRSWNKALGVHCEYCHVIGRNHTGFEIDDRTAKIKARQMVVMTQELNDHTKAVKGKVTCLMCHRGHPKPEATPRGGNEPE